jgi:hypothetical protein
VYRFLILSVSQFRCPRGTKIAPYPETDSASDVVDDWKTTSFNRIANSAKKYIVGSTWGYLPKPPSAAQGWTLCRIPPAPCSWLDTSAGSISAGFSNFLKAFQHTRERQRRYGVGDVVHQPVEQVTPWVLSWRVFLLVPCRYGREPVGAWKSYKKLTPVLCWFLAR